MKYDTKAKRISLRSMYKRIIDIAQTTDDKERIEKKKTKNGIQLFSKVFFSIDRVHKQKTK